MAVFLTETHKTNLCFLRQHPPDILSSFAGASIDYLLKGANLKSYMNVAKKFNVSVEKIQAAIESFAYIVMECYKYNVDQDNLHKIFKAADFSEQQVATLIDFCEKKKPMIEKLFTKPDVDSYFYALQWRFEAKIGSRSLLNQINPIVTLNFTTSDKCRADLTKQIQNNLLQTDPNTLIHLTNTLEKALQFSQSSAAHKVEKKIRKLVSD